MCHYYHNHHSNYIWKLKNLVTFLLSLPFDIFFCSPLMVGCRTCINPAASIISQAREVVVLFVFFLVIIFKPSKWLSVAHNSGWICKLSLSLSFNVIKHCLTFPHRGNWKQYDVICRQQRPSWPQKCSSRSSVLSNWRWSLLFEQNGKVQMGCKWLNVALLGSDGQRHKGFMHSIK